MAHSQEDNNHVAHKQCPQHLDQKLTMYCRAVDCQVALCNTCALVGHQGHVLVGTTDAVTDAVRAIRDSCLRLMQRKDQLYMRQNVVETIKESISNNFNQKETDLQESQEIMHQLIDYHSNNAESKLRSKYEKEMNRLIAITESINLITTQINDDCEAALQACAEDHPMQLLLSHKQIMDRLNDLETKEVPEDIPQIQDFIYSNTHDDIKDQIYKLLPYLWNIDMADQPPIVVPTQRKWHRNKFLTLIAVLVLVIALALTSVRPGPQVDPSQCTIRLGQPINIPGYVKATVQLYDYKEQRTTDKAVVTASQLWYSLPVQRHHDGTYSFIYSTKYGDVLRVSINGLHIPGSPFYIHKEVDAYNCYVIWKSLALKRYVKHYSIASMYLNWSVLQTVNYLGKPMTIGGAKVEVMQSEIYFPVVDHNNGTYTFEYNPIFGNIHIKVNGRYIKDNPAYPIMKPTPSYCRIHIGQPTLSFDSWLKRATVYTEVGNPECLSTGGVVVEAYEDGQQIDVYDYRNGTYYFYYYED